MSNLQKWCRGEDSNLQTLRYMVLNHACLPISPPRLAISAFKYKQNPKKRQLSIVMCPHRKPERSEGSAVCITYGLTVEKYLTTILYSIFSELFFIPLNQGFKETGASLFITPLRPPLIGYRGVVFYFKNFNLNNKLKNTNNKLPPLINKTFLTFFC